METQLQEAMASGVVVDFRDASDRSLAQGVFVDWRGRPVPAVGDTFSCEAASVATGQKEKTRGRVRARQFEVETDEHGQVSVWVRLVLDVCIGEESNPATTIARSFKLPFSAN